MLAWLVAATIDPSISGRTPAFGYSSYSAGNFFD
jgi:hypothetical protein